MGVGRAALLGAVAAVLVAVVAVVGVTLSKNDDATSMRRPGGQVMVVVAGHSGADPAVTAALVGIVDTSGGSPRLEMVDTGATVTIPGTSAARLRDAYAYGGAAGVSRAWASAHHVRPLPVVGVSEAAFLTIVARLGLVSVDIPSDENVFDGTRLYAFSKGTAAFPGPQLVALLAAADFAGGSEGEGIRLAVARGVVSSLASARPGMHDLVARGVTSTMDPEDLDAWATGIARGLGAMTVSPAGP